MRDWGSLSGEDKYLQKEKRASECRNAYNGGHGTDLHMVELYGHIQASELQSNMDKVH